MKKHTLVLAFLLVSYEGFGQTENVHSFYSCFALLRDCGAYVNARKQKVSQAEVEAATICAGYVMGVSDTHDMITALNSSPSFCAPDDVTVGQMVNPVHRYLVGNPERIHLSASNIIVNALKEEFPCP